MQGPGGADSQEKGPPPVVLGYLPPIPKFVPKKAPTLGFSPITTIHDTSGTHPRSPRLQHNSHRAFGGAIPEQSTETAPTPRVTPTSIPGPATKKRKGKMASAQDPYAFKRRLSDKEAKNVATAPTGPPPEKQTQVRPQSPNTL
ncbi:hypothetical protein BDZ91DRAFT_709775, partial [Kalaharituber pfeilii]